jgi:hypothetical protein
MLAQYFLTKFELHNALKPLKASARVSIVTAACFAEKWEELAKDLPKENDPVLNME